MMVATSSLVQELPRKQVASEKYLKNYYLIDHNSGVDGGEGKTVNIAWSSSSKPLGDAEYLAAMRSVVIPIIRVRTVFIRTSPL